MIPAVIAMTSHMLIYRICETFSACLVNSNFFFFCSVAAK